MPRVLVVLTSHDQLGCTGHKTGFWLEELAAPYYAFVDAGVELTLASPAGGQPPLDPKSADPESQTEATRRFNADEKAKAALASTVKLAGLKAEDYDAVFYPGGHGPLWDLAENAHSIKIIEDCDAQQRPLGLVCHAPGVLKHPKKADGKSIVAGRAVTGFSNSEEDAVGLSKVVPFLLEDVLVANGGKYQKGPNWMPFVQVDGKLVTGQNPASSAAVAEKLLTMIKH